MQDAPQIDDDIYCGTCQYNLRGLRVDGNCPECGASIAGGLTTDDEFGAIARALLKERTLQSFAPIAAAANSTVDAVRFVWDAWQWSHAQGLSPSTAADVCVVVRDYAREYFNDDSEAKELLAEWGIRRSEDVGRIVFAFVDAKWMVAEPHESVRDFDGRFTLDQLLDRPKP
jgi:uncharacterized repeat protein (TIGR04138 family)